MNSTQRNILIFLCVLVFLTVAAVLAAVFGWPFDVTDTTKDFARYGQVAVLGEIIGLFIVVARVVVLSPTSGAYSLVVSLHPDWSSLDLEWDLDSWFLKFGDQTLPVRPVRSDFGAAWEIRLPSEVYQKIQDTDVLELSLTDLKGNPWRAAEFFFKKQMLVTPLADKSKILDDYGYTDE